jgi:hypothetical protein
VYKGLHFSTIPKQRVKSNQSGRRLELLEAEEKSLVSFPKYMSDHGFPLTRAMIRIYAREVLRRLGKIIVISCFPD